MKKMQRAYVYIIFCPCSEFKKCCKLLTSKTISDTFDYYILITAKTHENQTETVEEWYETLYIKFPTNFWQDLKIIYNWQVSV